MNRRRFGGIACALLCVCWSAKALAASAETAASKPAAAAKPEQSSPKRKLPDYDGRGERKATPSETALWVPRLLLSPIYLVTEYGLRVPIGAGISAAERAHLPELFYNFFIFGPDHKAGFVPIAFVDFGFRPSIGLYIFGDDAVFEGNDFRLHGSTGGSDWLAAALTDRIALGKYDSLSFDFSAMRRPDRAFFGMGPDTLQDNISRYGETSYVGSATFDLAPSSALRIGSGVGARSSRFYDGHFDEDPALMARANSGAFSPPPGFEGYTAVTSRLGAALDTRVPRPAPGSGLRFEAEIDHGSDVRRSAGARWLRYGGTAVGFVDLNGYNRVVSLAVTAQFADPLGDLPIPFTEQVTLGGSAPMPGFYPGRLIDRSAAVATIKYRWPIWVWLDGSLQLATGNVFGEHLDGFGLRHLRMAGAIGIESIGSRDSSFQLLCGIGSETFEHGGQIDSIRVLIGSNHGF